MGPPNHRVEPTAEDLLAALAASWVPSLRSAAAHAKRWAPVRVEEAT